MSNFGWSDRNHPCGRFDIIQSAEFLDMDVYYIDIDYHNISNNYDQRDNKVVRKSKQLHIMMG